MSFRKKLTLPNGATTEVIPANNYILIQSGSPPKGLEGKLQPEKETDLSPAEMQWLYDSQKVLLTRCVGPLSFPDGRVRTIVDKPWPQTTAEEISIEELDQDSATFLIREINSLKKEVGQKASTFPAGVETAGNAAGGAGSTGAPLQPAAPGNSAVAG